MIGYKSIHLTLSSAALLAGACHADIAENDLVAIKHGQMLRIGSVLSTSDTVKVAWYYGIVDAQKDRDEHKYTRIVADHDAHDLTRIGSLEKLRWEHHKIGILKEKQFDDDFTHKTRLVRIQNKLYLAEFFRIDLSKREFDATLYEISANNFRDNFATVTFDEQQNIKVLDDSKKSLSFRGKSLQKDLSIILLSQGHGKTERINLRYANTGELQSRKPTTAGICKELSDSLRNGDHKFLSEEAKIHGFSIHSDEDGFGMTDTRALVENIAAQARMHRLDNEEKERHHELERVDSFPSGEPLYIEERSVIVEAPQSHERVEQDLESVSSDSAQENPAVPIIPNVQVPQVQAVPKIMMPDPTPNPKGYNGGCWEVGQDDSQGLTPYAAEDNLRLLRDTFGNDKKDLLLKPDEMPAEIPN